MDDERTRLLHLHLDGAIEKDLLIREQKRVGTDMSRAQAALVAAEAALGNEEDIYDQASTLLVQSSARFAALSNDEVRRQVALALVERIWLSSDRPSRVEMRAEVTTLHDAVKSASAGRYERSAATDDLGGHGSPPRALGAETANPAELDAGRVLVGAGAPFGTRVPLSDLWSG